MKLFAFAHVPTTSDDQNPTVELLRQLHDARARGGAFQAIYNRLLHGADVLHLIPSGGRRVSLYRDLLTLLVCRPFFRRVVQHWRTRGLGDWLEREGSPLERWIAHWLLGRSTVAFAPTIANLWDPLWFRPQRAEVLPEGIDDPCPDFERTVLPARTNRSADGVFKVLFLTTRWWYADIDSALAGVAAAAETSSLPIRLTIAGPAFRCGQEMEFRERWMSKTSAPPLHFETCANPSERSTIFRVHNCLLLPSSDASDEFAPIVLEAMAHGLPTVFVGSGYVEEWFPAEYPGRVEKARLFDRPQLFAAALLRAAIEDGTTLRRHFLKTFAPGPSAERMRTALAAAEA